MVTPDLERSSANHAGEHPIIRRTRRELERLDRRIADYEHQQAEMTERARRGLKVEPVWGWTRNILKEGGVIVPSNEALSVMATPAARDRALAVMGTLIDMLRERKLRMWVADGKTLVGRRDHTFALRLSEIAEKSRGLQNDTGDSSGWSATGRLRITLREGPAGDFRIRDESTSPIETQLSNLADYVARAIGQAPEWLRRREQGILAQGAETEKLMASRVAAERVEAERQRLLIEEATRREELLSEMRQWCESERLRAYIDAVLRRSGTVAPGSVVERWAAWARSVADAMDPLSKRLASFGETLPAPAGGKPVSG
ncbi:hypothetical protein [Ralstonia sp.]|uniref:hypothetical protein n=1 Tax=Ralstonia sp. TaxID=54061 RepID=UPI0031DDEEDD